MINQKPILGRGINWDDPLARGLVYCGLFNEGTGNKVYDLSGNFHTASFVTENIQWSSGPKGPCLAISNTDGRASYTPFSSGPEITISAWIQITTLTTNVGVVGHMKTLLAIRSTGTSFQWYPDVDTTYYSFAYNFAVGQWYHLVATQDAANNYAMYINGNIVKSGVSTVIIDQTLTNGNLGNYSTTWGPTGKIDDCKIYNRALSASEVQQLYMTPFRMFERKPFKLWTGSISGVITGTTCWGHSTGVTETNIRTFATHWTGTGEASGAGDAEILKLGVGEYMVSEVVNTGVRTVQLLQNQYAAGDDVTIAYRHGATQVACEAAAWNDYTIPFASAGYVQVKVTSTL